MSPTRIPANLLRTGSMAQDALSRDLRRRTTLPQALPRVERVVKALFQVFNQRYNSRYLVRLATDVIPTHPRYVSAVRARMGTLIEIFLAVIWNEFIEHGSNPDWRLSANYVTEYPNLYLRDQKGSIQLRIETKALHNEADEGAARFDVPTPLIDPSLDVLIVAGWKWHTEGTGARALLCPEIVDGATLSAMEVAKERDTRFRVLGGSFRPGGLPYVRSKNTGKWVPDPGNYGKLNRIIHSSRREEELSSEVKALQRLLRTVYPQRYGGTRHREDTAT